MLEGKTLLLVEDESLIAMSEKLDLEREGCKVIIAESGEEAVEMVCRKGEQVDLILMDIDLGAGIDGLTAARRILTSREIPLVFMSARCMSDTAATLEEISPYGFVEKLTSTSMLVQSLKTAFRLFEAKQEAETYRQQLRAMNTSTPDGLQDELLVARCAIDLSPASIAITDNTGSIEYVNAAFTEISGYSAAEAKGRNLLALQSGLTEPLEYELLRETVAQGNVWHGNFCNKKKNGDLYWEHALVAGVRDETGQIAHLVAVKEDVTELTMANTALKQSEELRRHAFENASDGIAILDADFEATFHSPRRQTMLGYDEHDRAGSIGPIHPDDMGAVGETFERLITTPDISAEVKFRVQHKNGRWRLLQARIRNLLENPYVHGFLVIYRDVTERSGE
ncbi:MAG TPA: PAS domain S-box protein [Bacteroidota bacterium]|nr:PAS domain S-box protein [Bacteroidota bacterium]